MQSHLVPRTLSGSEKPDKDVQVAFSTAPDGKAILFIHGFSGDAIKTWSDFHQILPESPKCAGRDLFFYGYDGLRAEMNASAAIFRAFLDRLFTKTNQFLAANLPASAQRPVGFAYEELTIVAHSLGAVVARRALLDATRAKSAWPSRIRLVLYAPAHMGANVADLALEAANSFLPLRFFGSIARFQSPLIDQLRPNSSELKQLLEDTRAHRLGGANPHLVARKVIIAERELIVRNGTFGDDPPPEAIAGTSHISVCKPRKDFLEPFAHLEECL